MEIRQNSIDIIYNKCKNRKINNLNAILKLKKEEEKKEIYKLTEIKNKEKNVLFKRKLLSPLKLRILHVNCSKPKVNKKLLKSNENKYYRAFIKITGNQSQELIKNKVFKDFEECYRKRKMEDEMMEKKRKLEKEKKKQIQLKRQKMREDWEKTRQLRIIKEKERIKKEEIQFKLFEDERIKKEEIQFKLLEEEIKKRKEKKKEEMQKMKKIIKNEKCRNFC